MITKLESIHKIKPIFLEYLNYISQFFDISDHKPWCERALKNLHRYSVEDGHYSYILVKSDSIIGFALINKHFRFNSDGLAVADFYLQKGYARKGNGRKLAEHVFAQFPGNWEVAVSSKNISAQKFWKQVISSYTCGKFREKTACSFSGFGFVFNNSQ